MKVGSRSLIALGEQSGFSNPTSPQLFEEGGWDWQITRDTQACRGGGGSDNYPHPLSYLYVNTGMQRCVESALSRELDGNGEGKFYCCFELVHWLCLGCYTGWGGVVRNALIMQLHCPALPSHPAFCLHLKPPTKNLQGLSFYAVTWRWKAAICLCLAGRAEAHPTFQSCLLSLWQESCDNISNPDPTVPQKTAACIHSSFCSFLALSTTPSPVLNFVKHPSISAAFSDNHDM